MSCSDKHSSMFVRITRIIFLVLIGACNVTTAGNHEIVIDTKCSDYQERIDTMLPDVRMLEAVTFESDVSFPDYEFNYLTDLHAGMPCTAHALKRAVFYLIEKNKFEKIIISLRESEHGCILHCKLIGFWTLHALKIHGMLLGKDRYRYHYLMEPGDPFDQHKHALSLEKIKDALQAEGYRGAAVNATMEYDATTKTITAHVTLKPGNKFSIKAVRLHVKTQDIHLSRNEIDALGDTLYKKFFKKIEKTAYSKTLLNAEMVALKRYLGKQGFLQVTIELEEKWDSATESVALQFILDLHKKKEFIFQGNHFFARDVLLDMFLLFGNAACLLPPVILQQELEKHYHSQGFWHVAITATEDEKGYYFAIQEGARAVIKKITLHKVQHYKAEQLIKDYFCEVLASAYYDEALMKKAVDDVIAYYVGQGFIDVRITKQEYGALDSHAHYELALTIDEGMRSYIDTIIIESHPELENEGPFLEFRRNAERVSFTMEKVQEYYAWLLNYFHAQGYPNVKIYSDFSREQDRVALVWKINKGEVLGRFGKTVVLGSSTFPFEYVQRELCYRFGELWDPHTLRKSLFKLKALNIFETVHVYPAKNLFSETEHPILIRLIQDDPFEVRLRAGFAVQQVTKFLNTAGLTYRIGGAFYIKNPFNRADQILMQADIDRSQRAVMIQYKCPWLFSLPLQTTLQGYDNKYQQPGLIGCKKNLYEILQQGFLLGLMRKYPYIDTGLNVGIELMETTLHDDTSEARPLVTLQLAKAINFEPSLLHKKIPYVQIEPTLLIDYVDFKMQPTCGLFTVISLKAMFPFGSNAGAHSFFVRFMAEQSFFIPLKAFVLAMRLRFGHIFNQLFNNIMPTERFYLGGANSIRSYETDRCPPLGVFIDDGQCPQYVPQGGRSMMNGSVELRFPIVKNIGGVVFQDIGSLMGDNIRDCLQRPVSAGTGFGIRYITALGPLRFDIAWKWHKTHPDELAYAWFLSFGQAF